MLVRIQYLLPIKKGKTEAHYPDEIWQIKVADVISNYYIRVHLPDKVLQVKRKLRENMNWSSVLLIVETSFSYKILFSGKYSGIVLCNCAN